MSTLGTDLLAVVRGCYGAVRVRDLDLSRTQRRHVASLVRTGELIAYEHGVVGIPGAERAVVLALVIALVVWWLVKKVMHALYILCSVALSGVNGYIIKHIDGRARPDQSFWLISEDSYSFPSGHATAVTALVISLVLVLTMTRFGRRIRHLLWVAAIAIIAFIAVTRLYLGVHWVTDVLGGFGVGLGSSMILAPFMLGRQALRTAR